jgi:hypothetical protein
MWADWSANPAEAETSSPAIVGSIDPKLVDSSSPANPIPARPAFRLASLEQDVASDADPEDKAEPPASMALRDSFEERFDSSFGNRGGPSFQERFAPQAEPAPRPMAYAAAPSAADLAAPNEPPPPAAADAVKHEPPHRALLLAPPKPAPVAQPSAAPSKDRIQTANLPSDANPTSPAPTGPATEPENHTAIYDITAHMVYMPNGETLEAHSGLGVNMDDPKSVKIRMHGPTPPNIYSLSLRKDLFHGVQAIRLNPVSGGGEMYGRAGILAHPYMLGPSGQSNGCVSFSNYQAFLNAYMKGEVDRLIVVDRLDVAPTARTGFGWITQSIKNLFKSS